MRAAARLWARLAEAILGKAGLALWEPEEAVSPMDLRESSSRV